MTFSAQMTIVLWIKILETLSVSIEEGQTDQHSRHS